MQIFFEIRLRMKKDAAAHTEIHNEPPNKRRTLSTVVPDSIKAASMVAMTIYLLAWDGGDDESTLALLLQNKICFSKKMKKRGRAGRWQDETGIFLNRNKALHNFN